MQLGNTVYAFHITEAYDDFEIELFFHEVINVAAKHKGLECIFMRQESFPVPLWPNSLLA